MPITLRQSATNGIHRGGPRTVTVTLGQTTVEGSHLVVDASCSTWDGTTTLTLGATGFTLVNETQQDNVKLARWVREGAPATSSIAVTVNVDQSLQVRVYEYQGVRASGAQDRNTVMSGNSTSFDTGSSGTTTQADELVLATVVNLYESAAQSGFTGGLTKLFETTSPTGDADHDRTRMSNHQLITTATGSFRLQGSLSTSREWVGLLTTFRGGTTGPVALTSTAAPPMMDFGGSGQLTVFGPLTSVAAPPMMDFGGSGAMHPFNYQYLLDGRLLIGAGTPYPVAEVEGLEGWEVRTSDDDLPRGDGAIRGIDLQSAREVMFKLKLWPTTGTRAELEQKLRDLYRVLIPRRDTDMELVWRHPDQPVKMLRCRPVDLAREMDRVQLVMTQQAFMLRAADPRHYAPVPTVVTIPVSPATGAATTVDVVNVGDAPAYPVIRVERPITATDTVTAIELVNDSADVTFAVTIPLLAGSVLIGDMEAKVLTAPRSTVTLNGSNVYGSWQLPRKPFYLAASPEVNVGVNQLYLRTTPPGAAVTCSVAYRHSWQG